MCDLISDVISNCAWSFEMGKIIVNNKISIKNEKKEKIGSW